MQKREPACKRGCSASANAPTAPQEQCNLQEAGGCTVRLARVSRLPDAPRPHSDALYDDQVLKFLDNPVTGLLPWIAMTIAIGPYSFRMGMGIGFALSGLLVAASRVRGEPLKILEISDAVLFGVLFVYAVIFNGPVIDNWFNNHADTVSNIGLSLLAFGSLAVGLPFTAQYTRVRLARLPRGMHRFLDRRSTLAWGFAFVVASFAGWYGEWILKDSNNTWTAWTFQTLPLIWAVIYVRWEDLRGLASLPGQASLARPKGVLLRSCSAWLVPAGIVGLIADDPPRWLSWPLIVAGVIGYLSGAALAARAVVGEPLALETSASPSVR